MNRGINLFAAAFFFVSTFSLNAQSSQKNNRYFGIDLAPMIKAFDNEESLDRIEFILRKKLGDRSNFVGKLGYNAHYNEISLNAPSGNYSVNYLAKTSIHLTAGLQKTILAGSVKIYEGIALAYTWNHATRSVEQISNQSDGDWYVRYIKSGNPPKRSFHSIGAIPHLGIDVPISNSLFLNVEAGLEVGMHVGNLDEFDVLTETLQRKNISTGYLRKALLNDISILFRF